MARITNAGAAWQSVTLTADEVWQVKQGAIVVDTDAVEAEREGVILQTLDAMRFASGKTIFYRLASGTSAVVARIAP